MVGLEDYEPVIKASAEQYPFGVISGDVLMLCAPSEESVTLARLAELDEDTLSFADTDVLVDDYTGGIAMSQYEEDSFRAKYGESPDGAIYRASINPVIAAGTGAGPGAEPGVRINRLRNGEPPRRGWRPADDVRHSEAVLSAETRLPEPEKTEEDFQRTARELSVTTGLSYGEAADAMRELARDGSDQLAYEGDEDTANEFGALCLAGDTLLAHAGGGASDEAVQLAQEADTADLLGLSARATVDEDEDEDDPVKHARKNGVRTRKDVAASEVERLHGMSLKLFGKRDTTESPHGWSPRTPGGNVQLKSAGASARSCCRPASCWPRRSCSPSP